jgi:hypothetical protein
MADLVSTSALEAYVPIQTYIRGSRALLYCYQKKIKGIRGERQLFRDGSSKK